MFDLFTFVAETAIQQDEPIPIRCDCGGMITLIPPLEREVIVCPACKSRIKVVVVSGDPGYVSASTPNGDPMLIPVHGSSPEKLAMSAEDREKTLDEIRNRIKN